MPRRRQPCSSPRSSVCSFDRTSDIVSKLHAHFLSFRYALTALVAFFHPDFSRIVSKQRPYPAAASEMKKILVSQVLLAGDPVFAVGAPSMFSLKSLKVQPESRNGTKVVRDALEIQAKR